MASHLRRNTHGRKRYGAVGRQAVLSRFCASWLVLLALAFTPCLAGAQKPVFVAEAGSALVADEGEPSPPAKEDSAPPPKQKPEVTLPEVPETTVIGRPGPFPATPLEAGTVLTPGRLETLAGEVASALTVIPEQQITRSRQTEVTEVLRGVPGLDVAQQGGPGGLTSVFLRGANSNHTKVLIDGIPVNDPGSAGRAFDFSQLSVDNIERIEILRGPQSTLYGSDAIGGVVNIITRRGQGPLAVSADLMGGAFGTSREAIGASGGTRDYHYSFGASYLQRDGFSAASRPPGNQERDGLRDATFSGRFGWTPSEAFDVDYVFRYVDQDAEIDDAGFGTPPQDNFIRQNRSEAFFNRVQARLMLLDGFWEQRAGFNLTDYDRRDTDPGLFFDPQFLGRARTFDYQSNFFLGENHVLSVGADYLNEESGIFSLSERSQHLKGVYFEDRIRLFDRWVTTAGFRWDEHSSAGSANTYRVTSRYKLPETGASLHGSIGTGFRAPALEELFNSFVGNPKLRPERSFGWDCGLEQSLFGGRLVLDGTYFRNDFTDLIQFDFATFALENVGRAFSSGVEVTVLWRLDECTTLSANYVHTFTEDLENQVPLLRRPKHKAYLGVNRRLWCDRANVNLYLLYVGPRQDTDPVTSLQTTLGEYYLLNLAGSYDLTESCQLFARLDNLLNENYEEVFGFQTAGLSGYGGLSFRW
jgi:vitamin B12 transporter